MAMVKKRHWAPSEGFEDKYRVYYASVLSNLPEDAIIAFSHARREEKEETLSGRVVRMLGTWSVIDIPLWLPEDVPHDRQGLFRGSHYQKELALMRSAASSVMVFIMTAVLSGRVVAVGYAALLWLQALFPQEVASGLLANVRHYCRLASDAGAREYFHSVFAEKLRGIGKPFLSIADFSAQLSAQLSSNMLEIWSERSPPERRSIGQKISRTKASLPASWKAAAKVRAFLTWSQKSDEELQAIRDKISETKQAKFAAMTEDEKTACRDKRTEALQSRSDEQRLATVQKFRASMASRTEVQRRASRHKWRLGFMARRMSWLAALKASFVRRAANPIRYQRWIENLRASIAKRTPERWAEIYMVKWVRCYSRPEWSFQHSLRVMEMQARKTPEARALENAKHKATCAEWTDEFRAQRIVNIKKAISERTEEASAQQVAKFKATMAAKTPEEIAQSSARRKAAAANMSASARASKARKHAESRARESQEQKDARKAANLKAIADKKDREASEQMERLRSGQMTAAERFCIVKNGKSRSKYQSANSSSASSDTLDEVVAAVQAMYAAEPSLVQSDRKAYLSKAKTSSQDPVATSDATAS
jgi:hypothetical protein